MLDGCTKHALATFAGGNLLLPSSRSYAGGAKSRVFVLRTVAQGKLP